MPEEKTIQKQLDALALNQARTDWEKIATTIGGAFKEGTNQGPELRQSPHKWCGYLHISGDWTTIAMNAGIHVDAVQKMFNEMRDQWIQARASRISAELARDMIKKMFSEKEASFE